jgi:hypothetical protein
MVNPIERKPYPNNINPKNLTNPTLHIDLVHHQTLNGAKRIRLKRSKMLPMTSAGFPHLSLYLLGKLIEIITPNVKYIKEVSNALVANP